MVFAIVAALAVAALIVHFVFTFAWYASGLAADQQEQQEKDKKRDAPIDVQFSDPNRT
jgi:phosphotransferase system  glucose/maltose/N-acetylglucosamine-specific IIC component